MNTRQNQQSGGQQNEGEGNKTAAREYNNGTTEFAKSGQVEGKGREAAGSAAVGNVPAQPT